MKIPSKIIMYIEPIAGGYEAFSDIYKITATGKTMAEVMGNAFDAVEKRFESQQKDKGQSESTIEIEFQ
jgi:predicted RNase H-like HicB family nuclease